MQKNFNTIKRELYRYATNSHQFKQLPLIDTIFSMSKSGHYDNKLDSFKKEFNTSLDRCDIRNVGTMIDFAKANRIRLPQWMLKKQFVIDYNNSGELDLIQLR